MTQPSLPLNSLTAVYEGWAGYQTSLLKAIEPRTPEELAFRAAPDLRSVGEIVRHISVGRYTWFLRMPIPGREEFVQQIPEWITDAEGNRHVREDALSTEPAELVRWLEMSWRVVETVLNQWTVEDLAKTYRHTFRGTTYDVSHQWTIWRILAHDIQHGGQISMLMYMQDIEIFELGFLGGHLTEPPLAK